jgi:putative membrane protein insertion efficiency factor
MPLALPPAIILTIILAVHLVITPATAWAQAAPPRQGSPQSHPVIAFYQRYISPVDGERCPMYPTCSAYAREAVERHGLFMGWIMACDRLVRCGRDETRISPTIVMKNSSMTLDPVSANDFWWYEQP